MSTRHPINRKAKASGGGRSGNQPGETAQGSATSIGDAQRVDRPDLTPHEADTSLPCGSGEVALTSSSVSAGDASHDNGGSGKISDTSRAGGSQGRTLPERMTSGQATAKAQVPEAQAKAKASGISIHVPTGPRALLLPYQLKWADDTARFKIGCMSRQVGKDFTSGEEGIRDCLLRELSGEKTTWLIAAPSERQSLESLEKWKEWVQAYSLEIEDLQVEKESAHPEAAIKSAAITLPHGSRVIAVPGKPDTVRGYSANILMTEFAFFEDPDKTWRAVLPSVTNSLRGGQKKVRLISTPNGIGNKFHDLWSKNHGVTGGKWSTHFVSIHDAVAQGLPVDVDELREALADPDGWAQEFECLFLDAAATLLPYELIALAEAAEATESVAPEYWYSRNPFQVVTGIDFGRKRDLTVAWSSECVSDLLITKQVLSMERTSTPAQVERLRPIVAKSALTCLDYTGPGIGLGDYLVKEFGEWNPAQDKFGKVELVTFSQTLKADVFSKLKMSFEARRQRIPISRLIREDLHSVNRVISANGGVSYRAQHTPDGHADRCTALGLCTRAASFRRGGFVWKPVSGLDRRGQRVGGRRSGILIG